MGFNMHLSHHTVSAQRLKKSVFMSYKKGKSKLFHIADTYFDLLIF